MLPNGTGCDGVSPCIALQHSNGAEHAMSRHRGDAALPFNHRIRVMRCRPVKFVRIVGLPVRKPDLTCLHACMQNTRLHAVAAAANAAQQTAVASVTSLLQERDRLLRENGDLRQEMARLQARGRP